MSDDVQIEFSFKRSQIFVYQYWKATNEEKAIDDAVTEAKKRGYKTFITSKKTSGTDEGKEFLANPGELIRKHKID